MSTFNRMHVVILTILVVAATSESAAQDTEARTAIVGCDLLTPPAPRALFLQLGDRFDRAGGGLVLGIDPERRSLRSDLREVEGLTCAQVLAEVLALGFVLEQFVAIGANEATGIWYWQRTP